MIASALCAQNVTLPLLLCVDATAVLCLWLFNASLTRKVRADPQRRVADGDDRVGIGGLGSHGGGGSLTVPSFAPAFGLPSPARRTFPVLI